MDRLKILQEKIKKFVKERDWERYHTPKNLAISVSIEAAELLEHFQWEEEREKSRFTEEEIQKIGEEIADVLIYLLHLSDRLGIDIIDASLKKLRKNEEKYPVNLFKAELFKENYKKIKR